MVKIFCFQNFTEIGLGIEKINLSLSEAMAFLIFNIAGIFTIRAGIGKIQIVFGITFFPEKITTLLTKFCYLLFQTRDCHGVS